MKPVKIAQSNKIHKRFRGFMPVVVDIETAGINPQKHAVLEICIVLLEMSEEGLFKRGQSFFEHVLPFPGTELDEKSLAFNQIDPYQPLRFAIDEKLALTNLFEQINKALQANRCQRAVLVGHNASFYLFFFKTST